MKEIWRKWRLCRYVKKNEHFLAVDPREEELIRTLVLSGIPESMGRAAAALSNTEYPKISRAKLAGFFTKHYFKEYRRGPDGPMNIYPNYSRDLEISQNIISGCIEKENDYLGKDHERIFLKDKGRTFAGTIGLLRSWEIYLGPFKGGVIGAIVVGLLWFITTHISSWI